MVDTSPDGKNCFDFKIRPSEMGEQEGRIVFSGFQLRKENNPDYDSDGETEFRSQNEPELVDAIFGREHKEWWPITYRL